MRVRYIVLCVILVLLGLGAAFWYWKRSVVEPIVVAVPELQLDRVEKAHRIVVFVHGTFGSTLGFLDVPSVMRDNLKGSLYTKTARSMRKDPFFFSSQPLLQRGLVSFEPSFDVKESVGFFAAYPIGKSVEGIFEQTEMADEIRHYYVFGWSGLLSQHKRRQESVRLLNELNAEVAKFKARGIVPKITVLSHSHGGNLVLNMGIITSILRSERLSTIVGVEHQASLSECRVMLARLATADDAASFQNQKKFDYCPTVPDWNIEHLVLLGMPVQPETDFGVGSSLFESIFHCYSLADRVQPGDGVSTSRYYSDRRFDRIEKLLHSQNSFLPRNLYQVRLMLDRAVSDDGYFVVKSDSAGEEKPFSWWNTLVGDLDSKPAHSDPTHKELWFLVFQKDPEQHSLKPLPLVSFMPAVVDFLQSTKNHVDVDFNISVREDKMFFEIAQHQKGKVLETKKLDLEQVNRLRLLAQQWEADSEFLAQEKSLLSYHLRAGREC